MDKTSKFIGAFLGTFILIMILAVLAAKNTTVLMGFSLVIPLVFFIYPRLLCTCSLYDMEMDSVKNKPSKALCYIPIYNTYFSRKMQYMSAPVVGGLLLFCTVEIFLITPIARFAFNSSNVGLVINLIVSWLNILTIFTLWGVEAYVNVKLARQVDYNNLMLCVLVPPVASFFLSKKINVFFRKNKNELRGTFKGGN